MVVRRHTDVILDLLAPQGRRVLDVGCGDGRLTRLLAGAGAAAVGLEPGQAALAAARAAAAVADERYVEGEAEALPFAEASFDAVVFLNALHHVPVERQAQARDEAARVLVERGHLLIVEPLAEGAYFDLVRQVDDESDVRASALKVIRATSPGTMRLVVETYYDSPILFTDFAGFKARMTAVNPLRAPTLARLEARLAADFAGTGRRTAAGIEFAQPTRANLFIRAKR